MNINQLFRRKSVDYILKQVKLGESDVDHVSLSKHLGLRDLTAFGIAAIIGAGVFSTIGNASFNGGPGVVLLFIFTAFACGFAAFAYAEFASLVPVSGSAYTYSYVAFGELVAWFIGWALIMEYAVGNVVVAVSWSDYFTGLLDKVNIPFLGINGIHIPEWASIDYFSAQNGFNDAAARITAGTALSDLSHAEQTAYLAWTNAPLLGSFHLIADIPAVVIVLIITALIYRGIKETRNASNIMVAIKLTIVLLVIAIGVFYVNTENWNPFLPNGIGGVLSGVSAVFFAYIGFDAISTTAEECVNPERDLPKSIMYSIVICTILYVAIALVLTGMVSYDQLAVGDPLAFVFEKVNLNWISGVIAISAVVAMASVLLVFQMGQPRIWMSMSRDGLLPKKFATVHRKFKTPSFSTIVTMFVVVIPILVIPTNIVLDLTSMGTLFAFVLVCGGVLKMQIDPNAPRGKFKTPYVNAKYLLPFFLVLAIFLVFTQAQGWKNQMLDFSGWNTIASNFPMWLFVILCFALSYYSFTKNLSLIPVLGLIFCFYMMAQIHYTSWIGFVIWLVVGLVIYFSYGFHNSKLHHLKKEG
ncbi:MAG: amino acid permease [Chitinophagaceae bacterium]|nr:amino acid permease [Chitinophagaceae bacterium]